jgi:energy-coupling factor transporter ATP-binding protein EcfA2
VINKITIENFRSFARVEVDQLAKFNVFLGRNGVGKTTLLEAFSIAASGGNPQAIMMTCRRRDLPPPNPQSDLALRSIFHNGRPKLSPKISYVSGRDVCELTIEPRFEFKSSDGAVEVQPITSEMAEESQIVGLSTSFRVGAKLRRQSFQVSRDPSRPGTIEFTERSGPSIPAPIAFTVQARQATSAAETADMLGRLFQRGKEDLFLKFMSVIRDDIIAVNSSVRAGETVISIKTKSGTRLLNEMGDGFCRLALFATGILGGRCKLIDVDEIDSGLHRSIMPSVWKGLRELAKNQSFQLVSTTHNEGMLETALDSFEEAQDEIAVFRLDPGIAGQPRVVRYSWEELKYAVESGVDPRG